MASLGTLQDLFVNEVRDMYDGERQISKALPKLAKASSTKELKSAFEEHQEQTLQHIERLEQVFEQLDTRVRGTRCHGIAGIVEEGSAYLDGRRGRVGRGRESSRRRRRWSITRSPRTARSWPMRGCSVVTMPPRSSSRVSARRRPQTRS